MPPSALRPLIALTQGDPAGVGPELCLAVASREDVLAACVPVIVGDLAVLRQAAHLLDLPLPSRTVPAGEAAAWAAKPDLAGPALIDCACLPAPVKPGCVDAACGAAAHRYLQLAIALARRGACDAITTAPISKAALHRAGIMADGHTGILAAETGTADYAMMQYSERLVVTFVTCHQPLAAVPGLLSRGRIVAVARLTDRAMRRIRGRAPRLAVLGLNPHAGEDGAFGREEIDIVGPAVADCRAAGLDAAGPIPPDAAFMPHMIGRFDAFVCLYHDQGHIPFKMVSLHDGVNVTLGLPIVRTSVDHGTAFDIAWRGQANPGSLVAALRLAARLAAQEFLAPGGRGC